MVVSLRAEELAEALGKDGKDRGTLLLLDVREPFERKTAAIQPSVHIPMNDIPERHAELPRDRRIVVYCHHGTRSAMVAAYLEKEGFTDVANLTGGIDAWSAKVDPTVPRYY
ncbi:MAG: sulfurtransferase [Thermoplasmata archaeon]|nr:sulfurtransferase [Thermoplasmata archaeon]